MILDIRAACERIAGGNDKPARQPDAERSFNDRSAPLIQLTLN
jgi:hypothetical protein